MNLTPFEPPVNIQTVAKEMEARPLVHAADTERGADVFVNVVKCIACHDVSGIEKPENQTLDDGVEIFPGPDLTGIAALNSIGYIEESILEPERRDCAWVRGSIRCNRRRCSSGNTCFTGR